jgi:glycosyltransferase involved in cell wall biosynthesis
MLRVAVVNRYLGTWGGGERVTYAIANQLSRRYHVDVLTDEKSVPTAVQIMDAFGPGHDGFGIRQLEDERAIGSSLGDYALLVNHCAGSSLENTCPIGLYFVMFPFQGLGPFVKSYDYFVCNSEYTRNYTQARWTVSSPMSVMYPGADIPFDVDFTKKERMILTVGRFNVSGHNKNQDLLIDSFVSMASRLPSGWSFQLLGRVNEGNQAYVASLVERCDGLPVEFHFNVDEEGKRDLLRRSSVYWHATGWQRREPDEAHMLEHFGISVVEAMGYGCMPICYDGGGPREIIEFGESGWLFSSQEELSIFSLLSAHNPVRLRTMQRAARRRALKFSRARFNQEFTDFMRQVAP